MNDIGYMYKQWLLKNKVKHKQRAPYICVDLRITFARRKSITIARKIYSRVFVFTFARIACYLEYI
jgi:ubiquinone biosynthesis protein Coq4